MPSSTENHVDSIYDSSHMPRRQRSYSLCKLAPVQGNNQGNVRHRVLRKAGYRRFQQHVSGGQGPFGVACQRDANDRPNSASVDSITLNHQDRTPEAGSRADWLVEICPAHITLANYHSTRRNVCRAALRVNSSASAPTTSRTLFIEDVILSSSC